MSKSIGFLQRRDHVTKVMVIARSSMNLYFHGIGSTADANDPPVDRADALAQPSCRKSDMIIANPPFGMKGGYTIVGDDGKISTEKQEYERDEFWATTANKQLNFLQHIVSELKVGDNAAVHSGYVVGDASGP